MSVCQCVSLSITHIMCLFRVPVRLPNSCLVVYSADLPPDLARKEQELLDKERELIEKEQSMKVTTGRRHTTTNKQTIMWPRKPEYISHCIGRTHHFPLFFVVPTETRGRSKIVRTYNQEKAKRRGVKVCGAFSCFLLFFLCCPPHVSFLSSLFSPPLTSSSAYRREELGQKEQTLTNLEEDLKKRIETQGGM